MATGRGKNDDEYISDVDTSVRKYWQTFVVILWEQLAQCISYVSYCIGGVKVMLGLGTACIHTYIYTLETNM